MTKLTTESLEKFVNDIKTDGMCDITDSQVGSALIRLLAYEKAGNSPVSDEITIEELQYRIHAHENDLTQMWTADYFLNVQKELLALKQAAKNPIGSFHISDGKVEATTDYCRDGEWPVQDGEVLVYAAPVLPKQPELMSIGELLHRLEEQTGEKWVEESEQSVIPDEINSAPDYVKALTKEGAYIYGWNECRAAAQPVIPEQHELVMKHSSVIAEQLAHVLSGMDVNSHNAHQRAVISCAIYKLNKTAEILQQKTTALIAPEKLDYQSAKELFNYLMNEEETNATVNGWNACRDEMLKAQQNEPQNIPENILAQPVSNPYKFLDERAKYRVIIEGFSNSRSVDFEACSQEEAEEIGRDIFHEECNYGVERLESIPAQESE